MYDLHGKIHLALEERLGSSMVANMGDVVLQFVAPIGDIYTEFSQTVDKNLTKLMGLDAENPAFNSFMKVCLGEENSSMPTLMLQQLLMAPLFALPRWSRDMQEISKHSEEPDWSLCKAAMERLDELSERLETAKKERKARSPTPLLLPLPPCTAYVVLCSVGIAAEGSGRALVVFRSASIYKASRKASRTSRGSCSWRGGLS